MEKYPKNVPSASIWICWTLLLIWLHAHSAVWNRVHKTSLPLLQVRLKCNFLLYSPSPCDNESNTYFILSSAGWTRRTCTKKSRRQGSVGKIVFWQIFAPARRQVTLLENSVELWAMIGRCMFISSAKFMPPPYCSHYANSNPARCELCTTSIRLFSCPHLHFRRRWWDTSTQFHNH